MEGEQPFEQSDHGDHHDHARVVPGSYALPFEETIIETSTITSRTGDGIDHSLVHAFNEPNSRSGI
jgi:hypothetical protein